MNRKIILMSSVSVVALAAVAGAAQAQDQSIPDGFTLSVEGGALFGPNTLAEDKLGGSGPSGGIVHMDDNVGYRAAISLGKRLDPFWDLRVTGAINQQLSSNAGFFASSGSASVSFSMDTDFDYETLDFEAGYRPALTENFDLRLFGGIRGLHYKDNIGVFGAISGSGGPDKVGISGDSTTEFFGAGPRLGVEASTRLGDTMFGVSGLLAGGAAFGVARTTGSATVSYVSGGSGGTVAVPFEAFEETETVYNLEAALGLDVHLDDAATVTLGYRAEGLFGTGNTSASGGSGSSARWTHGPTIKLTGYFD